MKSQNPGCKAILVTTLLNKKVTLLNQDKKSKTKEVRKTVSHEPIAKA